jgi:16S rRNA (uracil1498-N3)-methyltransferase
LNLFLLEDVLQEVEWSKNDPRAKHLKEVLRSQDGDRIDFGVVNGPRGKGTLKWTTSGKVRITLQWKSPHRSDLLPITLLIGLCRPQTCRKIIEQAATLGVEELIFFQPEKGELSYGDSSLWKNEWKSLLIKGAEQAFSCHLPMVKRVNCLKEAIEPILSQNTSRIALDVYDADSALSTNSSQRQARGVQLAIGPERGWSSQERDLLRRNEFQIYHMGPRVLRVETAMVAAIGYLSATYWPGRGWANE